MEAVMEYYLKCKNIKTAIRRAKRVLIAKAQKEGINEDFGQIEVEAIRSKFINCSDDIVQERTGAVFGRFAPLNTAPVDLLCVEYYCSSTPWSSAPP